MNLASLILWSASIIATLAGVYNIDTIQLGILKAQARLVYESRTETWGSPKFLVKEQRPQKYGKKNVQQRD